MFLFCHPWLTTTNLSYRFPILETSATASYGTTGKTFTTVTKRNIELHGNLVTCELRLRCAIVKWRLFQSNLNVLFPRTKKQRLEFTCLVHMPSIHLSSGLSLWFLANDTAIVSHNFEWNCQTALSSAVGQQESHKIVSLHLKALPLLSDCLLSPVSCSGSLWILNDCFAKTLSKFPSAPQCWRHNYVAAGRHSWPRE